MAKGGEYTDMAARLEMLSAAIEKMQLEKAEIERIISPDDPAHATAVNPELQESLINKVKESEEGEEDEEDDTEAGAPDTIEKKTRKGGSKPIAYEDRDEVQHKSRKNTLINGLKNATTKMKMMKEDFSLYNAADKSFGERAIKAMLKVERVAAIVGDKELRAQEIFDIWYS